MENRMDFPADDRPGTTSPAPVGPPGPDLAETLEAWYRAARARAVREARSKLSPRPPARPQGGPTPL